MSQPSLSDSLARPGHRRRRHKACYSAPCFLLLLVLSYVSIALGLDQAKAVDISRKIREEFRRTGFQWMSPKHYANMDKIANLKPYMFLFTTSSCTDCREMFEDLGHESPVFLSGISSQFNCILVLDDYNLEFGATHAPFGHDYVPRVIFADPDGTVRQDIINKRGDKATPFHYNAREMLWMMHNVLKQYNEEQEPFPDGLYDDLPS